MQATGRGRRAIASPAPSGRLHGGRRAGVVRARRGLPLAGALCVAALGLLGAPARAQEPPPYRTPRAGEGFETDLFGKKISVPQRDRRSTRALTLGGALFEPPLAGTGGSPLFNLYWRRYWDDWRVYGVFSGFYNFVEVGEHLATTEGRPRTIFEGVGNFENLTLPQPLSEVSASGREAEGSEVWWGRITLRAGPGLRRDLPPFGVDNSLRVQLLAQVEWDYFDDHEDTAPGALLPPDTLLYGARLAVRFDALERNLLELPHVGLAAGGNLDVLRRDPWRPAGRRGPDGARVGERPDTRDVLRLSAYGFAAFGAPFLSERHRFVAQVHAGWAPPGTLDRFSAFRYGAGPYQSEANDLGRVSYSAAMFEQLTAERYVVGGLTYRFEVLFFLYAHVRVLAAWGHFGEWDDPTWRLRFEERSALAYTAGLTSGFAFKSQLLVEYTYDTGLARHGREGHSVLIMWSKSF